MQRGLIALIAGVAIGLGTATPALAASDTLVSSGNATAVNAGSADLNGVVYRDRVGARWLFEYSTSADFDTSVVSTTPVAVSGRVTAVERAITGLSPDTVYYWRVVLVVRSGTQTAQTFGRTEALQTTSSATTASQIP